MSDHPRETDAPPAGEHIHMPEPSLLPLINAASLAGAIVIITMSWMALRRLQDHLPDLDRDLDPGRGA